MTLLLYQAVSYLDDIAVGIAGIATALKAIGRMLPLFLILCAAMLIVMIVR